MPTYKIFQVLFRLCYLRYCVMVMYPLRCCKDTTNFFSMQIKLYVIQHNNRLHLLKYAV